MDIFKSLLAKQRNCVTGGSPGRLREDDFFCGANLPWIAYGCDFGSNAWQPAGGMSQPERREILEQYFSLLSNAGVRVVRWFLLCDGRAGLQFDRDDVHLDATFFPDVDAALQMAERFRLQILFTLFDFHWFFPARVHGNVQAGGRGRFISDPRLRHSLLQNVVQQILQRYGNHPAIHSWDVFNEPEWIIRGLGSWKPLTSISLRKFRSFVKEVVHLIHLETSHAATLGLARRFSLRLFEDCSLDFYQVHWYDKQGSELWKPLQSSIPVVLGEFPGLQSRFLVGDILHHARKAGFAGALAWSAKHCLTVP